METRPRTEGTDTQSAVGAYLSRSVLAGELPNHVALLERDPRVLVLLALLVVRLDAALLDQRPAGLAMAAADQMPMDET